MPLSAPYLSTNQGFPKALRGLVLLFVGTTAGLAVADPEPLVQDVTTPGAIGTANALPPDSAANAETPATPANPRDKSAAQASDLSPGQNPNQSIGTPNAQVPNTPLLPQYPGNAFTPFSTTSALSTAQSPQITSPQLYTTGTHDLSQIAANTGLRQAFSDQPSTSGFLSNEQEGGYSYPPIERIRLGPVDLKAALVTSMVYDDNLRINDGTTTNGGNTGSRSDTSYTITPAVFLEYGAHEGQRGYASIVYSPSFQRFFHHSDQNTDNYQNVSFSGSYPFQRLTLNVSQTYSETAGVNQDFNARTVQTASATTFGGSYLIDDKMSLSVQGQYIDSSFSSPQGNTTTPGQVVGEGSETSSVNTTVSYRLTDKLALNPSVNVGVDKPENAPQQIYEQATMGATYQPREKLNLFAQAGLEFRQYDSGTVNGQTYNSDDQVNPIFSAGVGYAPFDSTTFTLSGSQSVHSSDANSVQTVLSTDVTFSATQRFFQRLFLNASINYSHTDTQATGNTTVTPTTPGTFLVGNEDLLTYRASLSIAPTAWSSASVYYQYLDNQSDQAGQSYHDNQIGIALSAQF